MNEKQKAILEAFEKGDISEAEATTLLGRVGGTQEVEYIEEAPEELGVVDRAIAQSFGANQEAKLAFYKKKYPESNIQLKDGRIAFIGKDGKGRFADPDAEGFDGVGEFSRDVLESVVPIGSGMLEAGAAGVGGLLGAAGGSFVAPGVGTTVGGLGGAMAAGSAAGGLIERARQGIGGALGMPGNVDEEEVTSAQQFGAVSPLLFGFDKPLRMAKGPLKSLVRNQEVGRGLVGKGLSAAKNKAFPAIAAMTSGKSSESIKTLMNNYDDIELMAKNERIGDLIQTVEDSAQDLMSNRDSIIKEQFGKALDVVSENQGVRFDTSEILNPLIELSEKTKIDFAEDFSKVATRNGVDQSNVNQTLINYFTGKGKAKKTAERNIRDIMKDTPSFKDLKYVEKTVDGIVETSQGQLTGSRALRLKDDLNKISGIKKSSERMGLDPLEQKVTNLTRDAAKKVDDGVLSLPGNQEFELAKRNYADWTKTKKRAQEFFGKQGSKSYKPGEATERTINKLVGGSREVEKGAILDTAEEIGLPFEKRAQDIKTLKDFFDPSISPVSDTVATGSRSIPAAALGAGAGYFAGEAAGGSAAARQAGAVTGAGLGVLLGGPKAVRAYSRQLRNMSRARDLAKQYSPISAPQAGNIWSNMSMGEE